MNKVKQQLAISQYRPEIDGLRALAVVAVIVNHFNEALAPSGYLGVDIFFVISGYVITSSIQNRPSKSFKQFITGFYERRIKRLIPALAVFVAVTSAASHLIVQNAGRYYATGALSMFGISNLYLLHERGGYWGHDASMNPFTQTWSLGVEEQFYIVFPLLMWISGFAQEKKNGIRTLFWSTGFLSAISLASFIYLYPLSQSAAYFLMPPRFWEMAAGCLVFIGTHDRRYPRETLKRLPSFPFLLLAVAIILLPSYQPVASTLAIVLTTCLLIASINNNTITSAILSNKAAVYIGLCSYSLYLWHWGVLALARWSIGVTSYTSMPLLSIIVLLSIVSYEFIEKKTRRAKWFNRKILNIIVGVSAAAFTASFSLLLATILRGNFYLGQNKSSNPTQNAFPDSTFHVIGDSHANDIFHILKNNGSYRLIDYSVGGCRFYHFDTSKCKVQENNKRRLLAAAKSGDIVIFASNYLAHIEVDHGELKSMINYLKEVLPLLLNKEVTVILKLPHPETNAPNEGGEGLICKREIFRPTISEKCLVEGIPKRSFHSKTMKLKPLIEYLNKHFAGVLLWDISDITCPGEYCYPVTEDKQYLRDWSHLFISSATLSDELTMDLNKLLEEQIANNMSNQGT